MIFLCIPPITCLLTLWSGSQAENERLDLRCFSPYKQYLSRGNLSIESRQEITAKDGLIQKIVKKGTSQTGRSLTNLPVFVCLSQAICYSKHNACIMICFVFFFLLLLNATSHRTRARLWEWIKGRPLTVTASLKAKTNKKKKNSSKDPYFSLTLNKLI